MISSVQYYKNKCSEIIFQVWIIGNERVHSLPLKLSINFVVLNIKIRVKCMGKKKSSYIYVLCQSPPHSGTVSTQPPQRYYDDIKLSPSPPQQLCNWNCDKFSFSV